MNQPKHLIRAILAIIVAASTSTFAVSAHAVSCYTGTFIEGCINICNQEGECKDLLNAGIVEQCVGSTIHITDKCKKAQICWLNEQASPQCQTYKSGKKTVFKDPTTGRTPDSVIAILDRIYKAPATETGAVKRLQSGETLQEYPGGDVLMPRKWLQLPTKVADNETIVSFSVKEAGTDTELVKFKKDKRNIHIPAKKLGHGKSYQWTASTDKKQYYGTFFIIDELDQKDFEKDMDSRMSNSEKSEHSRLMIKAILSHEYGLTYDTDRAIEALRRLRTNKGGYTK